MKRRVALNAGLFAMVIAAVSCGPNLNSLPPAPTGPTTLTPFLQPNVDGLWGGPVVLTGIAGGTGPARDAGGTECVAASFAAVIGEANDSTLSLTRAPNATNGEITGRLASAGTGLSCSYTGRVTNNTLLLTASTCEAPSLDFICSNDPNLPRRRLTIVGSTITASLNAPVNVTAISGTAAHTYNFFDTHNPPDVGALVANHEFAIFTRR